MSVNQQWLLVAVALLALIPAKIASSKGRSLLAWWIFGVAALPVAFVASLFARRPRPRRPA